MIDIVQIWRRSFPFFLREVFRQLHPGDPPLELTWYLQAICHSLDQTYTGDVHRLVINVPPRFGKSITTAVGFCAWLLGQDPTLKILVGTYNEDLARQHDQQLRKIMESPEYRRAFPGTVIDRKQTRMLDLRTTKGGFRMAVTTGGTATGFGGDYIILDDCMKAQDAGSEAERARVEQWYRGTIGTRLNNPQLGVIISIQQRLHEYDLSAVMLENGATHLNLPAVAPTQQTIALGRGKFHVFQPGDLLDPVRFGQAALAKLRTDMGPRNYNCQFLQDPTPPGGNLVRLEWFGRYDELLPRHHFSKVVQSWDTAASTEPGSAYSVCTTWGYLDRRWYLLDVLRERHNYWDLKRVVIRLWRQWQPDMVIIEDASTGSSLWSELSVEGPFRPIMWRANISKEERLIGQTGQMEAGKIVIPYEAPWLQEWCRELLAAPNCRFWDQVDSTTQFLEFALSRKGWIDAEYDPKTGRKLRIIRREGRRRG
ncbi:phage terminase large subunit [Altererythrobacter sp. KTW20L]|uniref:phage terminase large subunit n=1 Tax=Altererythrobacter sp. KTW20L TaxID=2942210 RepID=UPI0020BDFD73|nr:phage terminase large subunit [Altererythrobacter sp. KTW20L]MCL6250292.1 phage terminase large subunit [Altererythrobacter sp. KTW20L]